MARYLPTLLFFYLSFVLVVLWLCSTLFVSVYGSTVGVEEEENNVEIFDLAKISNSVKSFKGDGSEAGITLTKINFPLFAAVKDGAIVTLAEAEYNAVPGDDNGNNVGVISTCFKANDNKKWEKQEIEAAIIKSKTQLTIDKEEGILSTRKRTFVVNADREKIYILIVNVEESGGKNCEFKLLEGTISDDTDDSKKITWKAESPIDLKETEGSKNALNDYKITSFTADRSAFLIDDKKILIVVKGKLQNNKGSSVNTEKNFIAYFQYDESKPNELELLNVESTADFYSSFFEWDKKIYKIPTNGGNNKITVFNASQNNSFTESNSGSIFRLRDFLKNKNNFFTAAIKEGKSVLLFTQQRTNNNKDGKKDVHLWMTDGTRVGYVGTIITGFTEISYGPVVHTNNNLFVLHQTYDSESGKGQDNKFSLTLLEKQLKEINNIMTTWDGIKNIIEKLYRNTATGKTLCSTEGLVGFLHNMINVSTTKKEWKNEYLNINATINANGDVKVDVNNGVTFNGKGAGAQWPVGEQGLNQPYNFKDFGFTLVATVTIGSSGTNGEHNSILGFDLTRDINTKVSLWCTTNGEWRINSGISQNTLQTPKLACKRGKQYYIALTFNGNEFSAYVNGKQLPKLNSDKIQIRTQNIDHFYFGADTLSANTDVTITNVLLYNRLCEEGAIHQLKPEHDYTVDTEQHTQPIITDQQASNENTTRAESSSLNSSDTNDKEETVQSSSPPPTTEDSAARVAVDVLSLFFGVFTLLGRYVY